LVACLLGAVPALAGSGNFRQFPVLLQSQGHGFGGNLAALEDRVVVWTASECGDLFLFDVGSGLLIRPVGEQLPCEPSKGQGLAAGGRWFAVPVRADQQVYLFDADGELAHVLSAPDLDPSDDGFGSSVAVNDAVVAVGGARGGVYVFNTFTGDLLFRIDGPGAGRRGFGAALALAQGWLVVGDPSAGTLSGFEIQSRRHWSTKARSGGFGRTVVADGDRAATAQTDGKGRQVVFILNARTGVVVQRYRSPRRRSAEFGDALALRGDLLVVGAPGAPNGGLAYLYRLDRKQPITAVGWGSRTGQTVAIAGERVIVGAPQSSDVAVFSPR
jgi:hypothetical protein